jgi:3-oxoacyl-[acyl-carrier protein] reductase
LADTCTYSTTRPLFGQVAIVTGSSRGIGREIAITLARAGAQVVVNYLKNRESALEVVDECKDVGSKSIAVQADVTKESEVKQLVLEATSLGTPQILINNAGVAKSRMLMDTSVSEWNEVLAANLTAPFLCTREVLPYMLRLSYGRIINISSIWGITGGSCEAAYSAAKGGLITFTKALAKEIGRSGITVNAVAPGAIDTDMLSNLSSADKKIVENDIPVGRLGRPSDIAHTVLFLVDPASSYMTGQVISPNGGLVI